MASPIRIWASLGTVTIVVFGILMFDESTGLRKLSFIAMILVVAVGLKLTTPG